MRVLIFGASGATGRNLVSLALKHGHFVTAFVRNPSRLRLRDNRVNIFKGDVSSYQDVEEAIANQDAVLSALGASSPLKRDLTLVNGIQNITTAMTEGNVRRFIYQSFLGVKEGREELGFMTNYIFPAILRNVILDHEAKESLIVNSSLNWTIVRCSILTNGSFTGDYRDGEHITSASVLPSISRADVADFMLQQLAGNKYLHKKPRIMY
jgi:putative NADH-flavin reductase